MPRTQKPRRRSAVDPSIGSYSVAFLSFFVLLLLFVTMRYSRKCDLSGQNLPRDNILPPPSTDESSVQDALDFLFNNETASSSCLQLAFKLDEPYTEAYRKQSIDLDGPMYAFYRWHRKLEKKHIDMQKNATYDCRIILKVLRGELFVYNSNVCYNKSVTAASERYYTQIEMILLALEMYDIPDVDFVIELTDSPPDRPDADGWPPCLSYCLQPAPKEGFTYPSYSAHWYSLGSRQLRFYRLCQSKRYPYSDRIRKVVWRGSTTGPRFIDRKEHFDENLRIGLAKIGFADTEVLDVGLSAYVQINGEDQELVEELKKIAPVKPSISFEDFNKYVAVIDIDGNAWSERFTKLLNSNTPVLKQEYSRWGEYFAHLVTESKAVIFDADLSDVVERAQLLVDMYQNDRPKWEAYISAANRLAEEHLSHTGVIRAMAYAMAVQASFGTWTVEEEEDFELVPHSQCCHSNMGFPAELRARFNSD